MVLQATIRNRINALGENTSWALVTMISAAAADAVIDRGSELPKPLSVERHQRKIVEDSIREKGSLSSAAAVEEAAVGKAIMDLSADFMDLHEAFSAQPIEEVRARSSCYVLLAPLASAVFDQVRCLHNVVDSRLLWRGDCLILLVHRSLHEITLVARDFWPPYVRRPDPTRH